MWSFPGGSILCIYSYKSFLYYCCFKDSFGKSGLAKDTPWHIFGWVLRMWGVKKKKHCPKNHGISKLVIWRSQNPGIQSRTPLCWRVQRLGFQQKNNSTGRMQVLTIKIKGQTTSCFSCDVWTFCSSGWPPVLEKMIRWQCLPHLPRCSLSHTKNWLMSSLFGTSGWGFIWVLLKSSWTWFRQQWSRRCGISAEFPLWSSSSLPLTFWKLDDWAHALNQDWWKVQYSFALNHCLYKTANFCGFPKRRNEKMLHSYFSRCKLLVSGRLTKLGS